MSTITVHVILMEEHMTVYDLVSFLTDVTCVLRLEKLHRYCISDFSEPMGEYWDCKVALKLHMRCIL